MNIRMVHTHTNIYLCVCMYHSYIHLLSIYNDIYCCLYNDICIHIYMHIMDGEYCEHRNSALYIFLHNSRFLNIQENMYTVKIIFIIP